VGYVLFEPLIQNWKKRWFVLRADRLAYYKDERVSLPPPRN
jgi:hypothetical protein